MGEQTPLGKTPLGGNPSLDMTYLPTCLQRMCPEKDDKCYKSWAIIHVSCIYADDGLPRCECGDVPQENVTNNTKKAGRSFWAFTTCDFFPLG